MGYYDGSEYAANASSTLIGEIGDAELDLELRAKVVSMMDKLSTRLKEETQVESSLTKEDIKNYTNRVIQEVIRRKSKRSVILVLI